MMTLRPRSGSQTAGSPSKGRWRHDARPRTRFAPSAGAGRLHAWLLALCLLAAALSGFAASPASGASHSAAPTVILISLDGTRPVDVSARNLPSLVALQPQAAVAQKMIPATPSNTFPNHVSLITGVSPARHGVVNNIFEDDERGVFKKRDIPSWIDVEPLWSILAGEGIDSASYYWVGSEGPWRTGRGPRFWYPFSSRTSELAKAKQILAWLDLEETEGRPHFITSWFHGADHAGHHSGPGTEDVRLALNRQDPAIALLVDGLKQRGLLDSTTLIIVSDHGMASAEARINLGQVLRSAGIPGRVYGIGGFASLVLGGKASKRGEHAARAVAIARLQGLEAYLREDAPASFGAANSRFGDVVVRAAVGTAIVYTGLELAGFHGYDSQEPAMAAFFMALGRGAPPGAKLRPVRSIDVAPTVLALLGVGVPEWMEGAPIGAVLSFSEPFTPATSRAVPQDGDSATIAPARAE